MGRASSLSSLVVNDFFFRLVISVCHVALEITICDLDIDLGRMTKRQSSDEGIRRPVRLSDSPANNAPVAPLRFLAPGCSRGKFGAVTVVCSNHDRFVRSPPVRRPWSRQTCVLLTAAGADCWPLATSTDDANDADWRPSTATGPTLSVVVSQT